MFSPPRPLPHLPKKGRLCLSAFPHGTLAKPWGRCLVLSASGHRRPQGLLQVEEMADFPRLPVGLSPRHSWPGTHARPPPPPRHCQANPGSSRSVIPLRRVTQCSQPGHMAATACPGVSRALGPALAPPPGGSPGAVSMSVCEWLSQPFQESFPAFFPSLHGRVTKGALGCQAVLNHVHPCRSEALGPPPVLLARYGLCLTGD